MGSTQLVRRWHLVIPSKDPVKIAAEMILIEQGFTKNEAVLAVSHYRDGLGVSRQHIRWLVSAAKRHIYDIRDDMSIGTDLYQGIAYFWAHKYRFCMRGDAQPLQSKTPIEKARRIIHRRFLDEDLALHGETQRHDEIINEVFGINDYKQEANDE